MMDWLLYAAVLVGVAGAVMLIARSPTFWWELAMVALKAALPFILKRMPPDEEKEYNAMIRRGASQKELDDWRKWRKPQS